jgi:rubrerythrin
MPRGRKAKAEFRLEELLGQALETEKGGVLVYEAALECAVHEELKEEWQRYHQETREHVRVVTETMEALGLDPDRKTPGRRVVKHIGESLVQAIKMARAEGPPAAAQAVAAECVVSAETKDHLNWELIGFALKQATGVARDALKKAHDEVENQEDEHLYHTKGWARELWLESMGIPAVLPPPEEERRVRTAIGAARAKQARGRMRKSP